MRLCSMSLPRDVMGGFRGHRHTYLFFGLIAWVDAHADLSLHWVHIVFLLSCGRPCSVCLLRGVMGGLRLWLS